MSGPLVYRCSPAIAWVRDADQTLLVDRETAQSWSLHNPDALIWDLLVVGYSYEKIVQMLCLILSLSMAEAEHTLSDVLGNWRATGIVQVSGGLNFGEPDNQRGM